MRIAIDARPLHWPGIGRYIIELTKGLLRQDTGATFYIFLNDLEQARIFNGSEKQAVAVIMKSKVHSLREQGEIPWLLKKYKIDVFHAPSSLAAPLFVSCPMVLTVHDFLFKAKPEFLASILGQLYFNIIHHRSISQAARIITVSRFTQAEFGRFHPDKAHKVQTVWNGVPENFCVGRSRQNVNEFRKKIGVPLPYFLAVGSLKRHKNFATLLQAFAQLKSQGGHDAHLIIIAKKDLRNPDGSILELTERLGIKDHVTFADNLSEEHLSAAYSGAEAFVSTSIYEGFGLPIAEAMASGTPLIVSDIAIFHEITGGHAFFVEPLSPSAIAAAMAEVLNHKAGCSEMTEAALKYSTNFSWDKTAEKTLAVYHEATGKISGQTAENI